MSLTSGNKNNGKKGGKNSKNNIPAAKGFIKPGKTGGFSKKPIKTGGMRGS